MSLRLDSAVVRSTLMGVNSSKQPSPWVTFAEMDFQLNLALSYVTLVTCVVYVGAMLRLSPCRDILWKFLEEADLFLLFFCWFSAEISQNYPCTVADIEKRPHKCLIIKGHFVLFGIVNNKSYGYRPRFSCFNWSGIVEEKLAPLAPTPSGQAAQTQRSVDPR